MKLIKYLSSSTSRINGNALIRVDANEIADIEKMLILVDGDNVGNYGVKVELIKIGEKEQFGFPNASKIKQQTRYYKCFVRRD